MTGALALLVRPLQFSYAKLQALSDDTGDLSQVVPRIYGTPPEPVPAMAAE